MKIGQVAHKAEVNIQTVRFYERKGLIPNAPRSAAGYRQYDEGAVRRILFIRHAQEIGFSLREIQELLSLRVDHETSCADVQRKAEAKIEDVEEKIQKLQQVKQALGRLVVLCHMDKQSSDCPLLDALDEVNFSIQ